MRSLCYTSTVECGANASINEEIHCRTATNDED